MSQLMVRFAALLAVPGFLIEMASPAHACGGFFCSANAPVNQTAERIVFVKHDNDTVTAVVQIQYQGPSESFAWMLPVPGIPDVEVSSNLAFQRLQAASNPQYTFTNEVEGECADGAGCGLAETGSFASPGGDAGVVNEPPIVVLKEGTVGPFDYVVIEPNSALPMPGDVAVNWLTAEGYDVVAPGGDPADIAELLGSYLEAGMNLIAFRLTKGSDTGSIRPIRIRYATTQPMIPIRPTAVAADPDMGVLVWVLGPSRAVPVNYRSLELNEALIDWPNNGANYNAVVTAAADEAGGHGFVTEHADDAVFYRDAVFSEADAERWRDAQTFARSSTLQDAVALLSTRYGVWDGYRDAVAPLLADDVNVDDYLNCPTCFEGAVRTDFDLESLLAELNTTVIAPMRDTQTLFDDAAYATRLYTTLSAPEMDMDPLFDFNGQLDDVSNVHTARRIIECSPASDIFDAPSRIELEDGTIIRVAPGAPWPLLPTSAGVPANRRVLQFATTGNGTVVADNNSTIDAALEAYNQTVAGPAGLAGGSCNMRSGLARSFLGILLPIGLALLGIAWRRRRRFSRV